MPIYEYHCGACDKDHEIIQKVSDLPLECCPACGGKMQKKVSLSSFQLKGGGWYKDGYAAPKPEAKKPEVKKEATPPSPPAAPKTEPVKKD